jgi:hypothetical protein
VPGVAGAACISAAGISGSSDTVGIPGSSGVPGFRLPLASAAARMADIACASDSGSISGIPSVIVVSGVAGISGIAGVPGLLGEPGRPNIAKTAPLPKLAEKIKTVARMRVKIFENFMNGLLQINLT